MHRVLLVRHGESEHHIRGMTGGWTDLPLTKLGQEQAIRTAEGIRELVAEGGAAVFASDLLRALMTAEPICRLLGIAMNPVPELREFNNGVASGLSLNAAKAIELPPAGDPIDWQPYSGAETWRTMTARVVSAMERLVPHLPQVAVVVTHGNSGTAVIRWWLGLTDPDKHRISFDLDCCSITDLYENEWGERTIRRLNDVAHLQAGS